MAVERIVNRLCTVCDGACGIRVRITSSLNSFDVPAEVNDVEVEL